MGEIVTTVGDLRKIISEESNKEVKKNDETYKGRQTTVMNASKNNLNKDTFTPKEPHEELDIFGDGSYRKLGMDRLKYDIEPSETFKKRANDAIEGSSVMGNGKSDGVSHDGNEKFLKKTKKLNQFDNNHTGFGKNNNGVIQMGDDVEIIPNSSPAKKHNAYESKNVKKLNFKNTVFLSEDHVKKLIPEEFKKTGTSFIMKDSTNKQYMVTWGNNVSECKVMGIDKKEKSEEFAHIKHLWEYKSSDYFNKSTNSDRLNEENSAHKIIQNLRRG